MSEDFLKYANREYVFERLAEVACLDEVVEQVHPDAPKSIITTMSIYLDRRIHRQGLGEIKTPLTESLSECLDHDYLKLEKFREYLGEYCSFMAEISEDFLEYSNIVMEGDELNEKSPIINNMVILKMMELLLVYFGLEEDIPGYWKGKDELDNEEFDKIKQESPDGTVRGFVEYLLKK